MLNINGYIITAAIWFYIGSMAVILVQSLLNIKKTNDSMQDMREQRDKINAMLDISEKIRNDLLEEHKKVFDKTFTEANE